MAPYGIAASVGGDSKDNVAKLERCVVNVMAEDKGIDKAQAVAICKAAIWDEERKPVRHKRKTKNV